MKKLILSISILFFGVIIAKAQNYTWSRMPSMPQPVYAPATFTLNGKIYVVSGATTPGTSPKTLSNQVWEFNPANQTWTRKNDYPGVAVYECRGVSVGNYGYVINGWNYLGNGSGPDTMWRYDSNNDSWTAMPPFPGSKRYTTATFVLNDKIYIGLGYAPYMNDFWCYDPSTNSWSQKSSLPGTPRQAPIWFTLGGVAYVGMGTTSGNYILSDWYRYDPTTDTWTQLGYFPSDPVTSAYTFELNGEGYMVSGLNQNNVNFGIGASSKIWKYNPNLDSWSFWGVLPDTAMFEGTTGVVNGAAYLGGGSKNYSTFPVANTYWRFGPAFGSPSCNATITALRINSGTFNFQAGGNFSPSASVSWSFSDGATASGTSVIHNFGAAGNFQVILSITDTANGGCTFTTSDSVYISNISNCTVSIDNSNISNMFELYTNTTGFGPYQYIWTCQQDPSWHSSVPNPLVILQPNIPYTYCVKITDSTGCAADACKQITYVPDTAACDVFFYIYPDPTLPGWYDGNVYYSGGNPVSWSWSFGDGASSPDSLPTYQYANPAFYTLCLTVTDDRGCTASYCDSFFYAFKTGGGPMKGIKINKRLAANIASINDSGFDVWPNPASNQVNFLFSGQNQDVVNITITNSIGQVMFSKDISESASHILDVSHFPKGLYTLNANFGNKAYIRKLVVE